MSQTSDKKELDSFTPISESWWGGGEVNKNVNI